MIVPLFVGREKSVKALEEVMKDDKQILLIAQKNATQDDPGPDDIYTIGTLGTVLQLLKLPDDTVKVLVEGGRRVRDRRLYRQDRVLRGATPSRWKRRRPMPPSCRPPRAPWSRSSRTT